MTASARLAYLDYHPGPGDATAHFAEETMARAASDPQGANGDAVTMTVSHLESPSVQTAWRLRMAELQISLRLETFFEQVQSPDMGSYSLVMQAWGTKLGVDPALNARFGQMMSG